MSAVTPHQNPEDKPNKRRRRVLHAPHQFVVHLLSRGLRRGPRLILPEPVGLPATANVVGVYTDYSRDSFAIVVEDEAFEEVPDGFSIPELEVRWTVIELPIAGSV